MRRGHSDAQSRGALRYGWRPNRWNEEPFALEGRCQIERCLLVANDPGKNRARGDAALFVWPTTREAVLHRSNSFPKQKSPFFYFRRCEEVNRSHVCGSYWWRLCCVVNEGAGAIDQPFDKTAGTGDVTAACAERLAQCSHLNVDIVTYVLCGSQAAAIWTDHADSVRFVEHQERPKMFF